MEVLRKTSEKFLIFNIIKNLDVTLEGKTMKENDFYYPCHMSYSKR